MASMPRRSPDAPDIPMTGRPVLATAKRPNSREGIEQREARRALVHNTPEYDALLEKLKKSVADGRTSVTENREFVMPMSDILRGQKATRAEAAARISADCPGINCTKENIRGAERNERAKKARSEKKLKPPAPAESESHREARLLCAAADPVKLRLQNKIAELMLEMHGMRQPAADGATQQAGVGGRQKLVEENMNQGHLIEQLTNQRNELQVKSEGQAARVEELEFKLMGLRAELDRFAEREKAALMEKQENARVESELRVKSEAQERLLIEKQATIDAEALRYRSLQAQLDTIKIDTTKSVIATYNLKYGEDLKMARDEVRKEEREKAAADAQALRDENQVLQQENDRLVAEDKAKDDELESLRVTDIRIEDQSLRFRLQRLFFHVKSDGTNDLRYPAAILIKLRNGKPEGIFGEYYATNQKGDIAEAASTKGEGTAENV